MIARHVGRSAGKDEAPIAIAAIDEAALIDLQPHPRMTERRRAGQIAGPVTSDSRLGNAGGFGGGLHERCVAMHRPLDNAFKE